MKSAHLISSLVCPDCDLVAARTSQSNLLSPNIQPISPKAIFSSLTVCVKISEHMP
jgi:hypothetical protein